MKQSLLILFIIIATPDIYGQASWIRNRDSLLDVLSRSKEDTEKVWTQLHLGQAYLDNQPDSALLYAKEFGILSTKLHYTAGEAFSLSMQALVLSGENKKEEAILMNLKAIEMAKREHLQRPLANLYNNLAKIYCSQSDIPAGLDLYLKAETIFEELQDSSSLAFLYGNLAMVYISLKENEKAYEYALKGISLSRSLHITFGLGATMINLSSSLLNLQRFDTALIVLKETKELLTRENGPGADTKVLALINLVYLGTEEYDLLKTNSAELMKVARSVDDGEGECNALFGLVHYYIYKKEYAKASHDAVSAIEIAQNKDLINSLISAYGLASRVEIAKGDLMGYDYYNNLKEDKENEVRVNNMLKNSQELEVKYSVSKKQAQIDVLNKQNTIQQLTLRQRNTMNWVLASVVLIAGLISFLYNRNYRQRKKLLIADTLIQQQRITELEKEKKLLAAEAVLQGQVEERTRLAKDLHDGLGSVLSSAKFSFVHIKEDLMITGEDGNLFDRGIGILDKAISELRRVAHNMMPEALVKFGLDTALRDFCDSIELSGALHLTYQSFEMDEATISKTNSMAVYRIIQELVNNILKHSGATEALVQLVRKNDTLSITVEDNGKGFDAGILENNKGMGYLNLRNRVTYLNGVIDIQTTAGKGASINIEISNIRM